MSPEGVYYLDNANDEAEFDASFDINMDNMIDSDEHIQGQTWLKTWNSTYEDGSGFAAVADFTDFTSDEVSAMDANFDQQIDVLEFLTFNSYKAYWNMNIYDNITFTEDIALEGTYRNWADYSIEGYTSDMFSAMDTDQSGDVSYDEYVQWLTVQNTYLNEIAQSHYPLDYVLQTVCEEDSNYDLISKTAREFADQDFDGVVSWEEYVISQIQVQQFANAQVDGVIAATDFTTAENYTEGQMTLLDYNQDGEVTIDEWYVYMIATRVWSELTNVTQAEIFTQPEDFSNTYFNYFDQNLDTEVTFSEYCIASADSITFSSYLVDDNINIVLADLGWTTLENNWIDLNSDSEVDFYEWQAAYVDLHNFYLMSEGADVSTITQASAKNYTDAQINLMDSNGDG